MTSVSETYLLTQLYALHMQIEALIVAVQGMPVHDEAGCPHPETHNIGTFGAPSLKCVRCGQIVEAA
jgi:hypothetical protein